MNLVYGPAGQGSFEAQWLEYPTGGQGLSPVGDSDFFFVPCSWHVEHIIFHFFTEPRIYHLKFLYISHSLRFRHCFSSQYAGRVSYMYLVYGPARHESFIGQWLEHPLGFRKVVGSNPVGDSDFFFVPCSWHVEHTIPHFFTEPLPSLFIYHTHDDFAALLDSLFGYSNASYLRDMIEHCFFSPLFDVAEPCEVADIVKAKDWLKSHVDGHVFVPCAKRRGQCAVLHHNVSR